MVSDALTERVIGMCIAVHREIGPGLLESAYESCLAYELKQAGVQFKRQVELPVTYKGIRLECGYRLDLVIEGRLILELKCVESLLPIHHAQLLSYMKLSGIRMGLLINFHTVLLKDGIKRFVL